MCIFVLNILNKLEVFIFKNNILIVFRNYERWIGSYKKYFYFKIMREDFVFMRIYFVIVS